MRGLRIWVWGDFGIEMRYFWQAEDKERVILEEMEKLDEVHVRQDFGIELNREVLELSSCIEKLKEKIAIEKQKTVPFNKWILTGKPFHPYQPSPDTFNQYRDEILKRHKHINEQDFEYFAYTLKTLKQNKADFTEEKDKRYRYCVAKYRKPKIVHTEEVDPVFSPLSSYRTRPIAFCSTTTLLCQKQQR